MSRVTLVLVSMLLAACGPGGIEPDAGVDVDANGTGDPSGLELRWTASGLGEQLESVVIEQLTMELRDLRVIGDAAPEATYRASQTIELRDGEEEVTEFPDAPPGRYSAFEFAIERPGDGDPSWELRGEVLIDGETYNLEVGDEMTSSVSLSFDPDLILAAGEIGVITLEVDVASVVDEPGIDWASEVPDQGEDTVTIDDDSSLLPIMRQRLRLAVRVAGIDVQ